MKRLLHVFMCIMAVVCLPLAASAQLTANFNASITSGCSPILVSFTDQSSGNPSSWQWNMGNGSTSTLQNPSTIYYVPGVYTVSLTVSNGSASNTKTMAGYITVLPNPQVNFLGSDTTLACAPKTIGFTNLTVPGTAGAVTYSWDFGDGTASNAASPSHTYNAPGMYSVQLIATNSAGCVSSVTKNNYIKLVQPTASFTASNVTSCTVPLTTSFTNTSTGAVSYAWTFGDGGTSTAANPSHTYNAAGNYTVSLVATNSSGCKDTFVYNTQIHVGNLEAGFTKSATTICAGVPLSLTNTSVGATTYAWSFGDGGSATTANASHAYAAGGTYTIRLIAKNGNCSDTTTQTITVLPKPVAQFTGSPLISCSVPLTTSFTNTTTGATSYAWTFGDGGTSTAANPSHTYNAFGNYSVRLIATNSNGCSDTLVRSQYVKIQPGTLNLTGDTMLGCAPATGTFTAVPSGQITVTSYSWNWGDGSSSTSTTATSSHTYTNPGTYTITVSCTTSTNCIYTKTKTVHVGSKPTASFSASPDSVCVQQGVVFVNNSTGATSYTWHFGDGGTSNLANPTYSYGAPGTYNPMLIASNNGCSDTFIYNSIYVVGPIANFTHSFTCANKKLITFNNTSTGGTSYLWNFGDGTSSTQTSPTHLYAAEGNYTVTLTVYSALCTNVVQKQVFIQLPIASFSTNDTAVCKGSPVAFMAAVPVPFSSQVYTWDFGDGSGNHPFNTNQPVHVYTQPGIYTVKLITQDLNGCRDTMIRTNYIKVGGPTIAFNASPQLGCPALTVNFTSNVTSAVGYAIGNKTWLFGDGTSTTTSGNTVSHTYANVGSYTVKLIAVDAKGCKDTLTKPAYIQVTKPNAAFSTADTNKCLGLPVAFTNTSTGVGATYAWNFGDGTTSTQASPSHTYTTAGTYTVSLIVTDQNGCKDTMLRTNYVHISGPDAAFSMSDSVASCPPLTVNMTNNSAGATSYAWSFGNGSQSVLTNPVTSFTIPGTYTVKLVAQSASGCKDSTTRTVFVDGPYGTLSYNPLDGCAPVSISFNVAATGTTSYYWDMSNGVTQQTTTGTLNYTFTTPGVYVPTVILSNGANCNVAIHGADTINIDAVQADFTHTPSVGCESASIQFFDTVYASAGAITTRLWNFGDGGSSTQHNPSHTYTSAGTYTVSLIVTNANGCIDTVSKSITVNANPTVTTNGSQSICAGGSVNLQASGAASYVWSPATGLSSSTIANPTASPAATTTYTVTGTASNGCPDTAMVTVVVNPLPVVDAGTAQMICSGASAQLQATGATTYSWSPATGLSNAAIANPTASPATTTTYTVTGTSALGCVATDTVTVVVGQTLSVSAGQNQTLCQGGSVNLNATGAASYSWSPATGLSNANIANPTASPSATTTYVVTGTNAQGCTDTAHVTVFVTNLPVIQAGADQAVCAGDTAQLQASGANTYVWSPAAGLSNPNIANPKATPTVTTAYVVTGIAGGGCSGSDTVVVTVHAKPVVSAGADTAVCAGGSVTLNASGATTYSWSPATGLSNAAIASPIATPTATTAYVLSGTNASGCVSTDTVVVSVHALPVVSGGANQTICVGGSVTLNASGAASYSWSPATGLSNTNTANPVASPATTTTYVVSGMNAQGCADTAHVTVTVTNLPNVQAGPDQSICAGTSASLSASGATTYSWSPATGLSNANIANPVATPSVTTTYVVTGTASGGCSHTDTVVVSIKPAATVSGGASQIICAGDTAQLQASGAASYSWSPATGLSNANIANPTASPATTTTYVVTGTNAQGCTDTAHVTVTVKALPVVSAGANQLICNSGSATLQASGAQDYIWSPASSLSCDTCASTVASPAATTIYVVSGTDASGCTNTDSVTVGFYQAPTVSAGANQVICLGSSTQLQATGAVSYNWSPATGLSNATIANPTASPAATTTYVVTGTDANGCTDTAHVTVSVANAPVISAGAGQAICAGQSVNLQASGGVTYQWFPAASLSNANIANPVATPAATTTYSVVGSSGPGCTDTATVTITVNPKPVITVNNPAVCKGEQASLQASGAVSYVWSPTTGLSNPVAAFLTLTPAATTTYTVTGTDANGCTNTATATVTVHQPPAVSAGADQSICRGQSAQLQASGAASYVWSPAASLNNSTIANPLASPTATTVYTVVGTDVNGCRDSSRVTIQVQQPAPVQAGPGGAVCEGESVQLNASGGSSYSWYPATGLSNPGIANPVASPAKTTTYSVVISQGNCFADTAKVTVVVHPKPVINAGADQSTFAGSSVNIYATAQHAQTYTWTPAASLSCADCLTPIATPSQTTTYTIHAVSAFGCEASDEVTIRIKCDNSQIFIPNTFTPNGDGQNDFFFPHGQGIQKVLRLRIYDRWGELVFDGQNMDVNDLARGWDGSFRGQPLKPDVYVYILDALCISGEPMTVKGDISLLR